MTDRHLASSTRLLARYGGTVTLSRTVTTGGSPSTGGGTTTTTNYSVQFLKTEAEERFVAAGLIRETDLTGIMGPHPDVIPQPGDKIAVGGKSYNLLLAAPVRADPTGPVIHFALHGWA